MRILRMAALLAASLVLSAQTSPVTVTPTLVSVQLGQPLYCAAAWLKTSGQVQAYCYTSTAGHTWDSLVYNSIFFVNTTITLPYISTCSPATSCPVNAGIMWFFWQDAKTAGLIHWQVAWNGTGMQAGTFQ